jgi:hypothetical protein
MHSWTTPAEVRQQQEEDRQQTSLVLQALRRVGPTVGAFSDLADVTRAAQCSRGMQGAFGVKALRAAAVSGTR